MGPHYDSPNESVIPPVEIAAPRRLAGKSRRSAYDGRPSPLHIARKALAGASVRRDHEPIVKLQ
jgi:hypothetical protein